MSKKQKWFIGIVTAIGAIWLLSDMAAGFRTADAGTAGAHITYRVRGTASNAEASYANGSNGTSIVHVSNPRPANYDAQMFWEETVDIGADTPYLTVQNGSADGTVVAEIWRDGNLLKHSESSGAYAIATVSGN